MVGSNEGGQVRPPRSVRVLAALFAAGALFCCSSTTIVNSTPPGDADGGTTDEDGGGTTEDGGGGLSCPTAGKATVAGTIDTAEADETSGIVASTKNEGIFWIHNDSGDVARTFAITKSGHLVATLNFDTVKPQDIEDIEIDDTGDKPYLYLADMGDNAESRTDHVIHRVEEPKLGTETALTTTSDKMTVRYPDGPHNAETLLFDPISKDIFIATKKPGGPSYIHRVGPFEAGKTVTTEKVATVTVDTATGGDISRDGHYIVIRNYSKSAFLWLRNDGESVADALARDPCTIPIAAETQGEAFAFMPDGKAFVTTSEGLMQDLHLTPFE